MGHGSWERPSTSAYYLLSITHNQPFICCACYDDKGNGLYAAGNNSPLRVRFLQVIFKKETASHDSHPVHYVDNSDNYYWNETAPRRDNRGRKRKVQASVFPPQMGLSNDANARNHNIHTSFIPAGISKPRL